MHKNDKLEGSNYKFLPSSVLSNMFQHTSDSGLQTGVKILKMKRMKNTQDD